MSAPAPTPTLTKKQQKALKHHSSASTPAAAAASTSTLPPTTTDEVVSDPLSLLPRGKKTKNKRKLARDEKAGEDVIGDEEEEVMGEEQEEKRVIKKMKVDGGKEGKATKVEGAAAGAAGEKKAPGTPGERGKPKTKARFILFVGECLVLRSTRRGRKEEKRASSSSPSFSLLRLLFLIGNLPFTTTGPEVATFFEEHIKFKPTVRLLTSKPDPNAKGKAREGGKSRGIAFVE